MKISILAGLLLLAPAIVRAQTVPSHAVNNVRLPENPVPKPGMRVLRPCPLSLRRCGSLVPHPHSTFLTDRDPSWWSAFKRPPMLIATGIVIAAEVIDVEGTKACLDARTCSEGDPLFGTHPSRLRLYGTVAPLTAAAVWAMVKGKQEGHGKWSLLAAVPCTILHIRLGIRGFHDASI
jgi:hypothetical protein